MPGRPRFPLWHLSHRRMRGFRTSFIRHIGDAPLAPPKAAPKPFPRGTLRRVEASPASSPASLDRPNDRVLPYSVETSQRPSLGYCVHLTDKANSNPDPFWARVDW